MTIDIDNSPCAIAVYAKPNANGIYLPRVAPGEGIACVDDNARAVILALSHYEKYGDQKSLDLAKEWVTFVKHMTDRVGRVANFISEEGVINELGQTSQRGGQWWQARAMWAYARMYRVTSDTPYLDLYWATKRNLKVTDPKVIAIDNIVTCELMDLNIQQSLTPVMYGNFFRMGETFGYHQLLAGWQMVKQRKASSALPDRAIVEYVKPMIEDRFWSEWKTRSKDGLCAYVVSPIVQGLALANRITGRYDKLLEDSINWFIGGNNDITRIMYDPETGRCFDGLYSEDCGAESSIEAGLAYLEVN